MRRDYQTQEDIDRWASREKFRVGPICINPALYEIDPQRPKYVIRALYGPVVGKWTNTIVAFPYDAELLQLKHESPEQPRFSIDDRFGSWGPREFLRHLLSAVAKVHGDCAVLYSHNSLHVEVDASTFHKWADLANRDPVTCLLDPTRLFGNRK